MAARTGDVARVPAERPIPDEAQLEPRISYAGALRWHVGDSSTPSSDSFWSSSSLDSPIG